MIPPAFSEVRKNMLPGKLLELIEYMPEMKNRKISNNEGCTEPVDQMNNVVMIKVVPNICEIEVTVIVISVMSFS